MTRDYDISILRREIRDLRLPIYKELARKALKYAAYAVVLGAVAWEMSETILGVLGA